MAVLDLLEKLTERGEPERPAPAAEAIQNQVIEIEAQMKEYEERYCSVCGMAFTPRRINQMTCAREECKAERTRQHQIEWHKRHREETLKAKRKYMYNQRHGIEPVQDTIVAIGYADRQRAETLKMVGRIKVEL